MSGIGGYLGRALASRESAYFLNQSKHAVGNLKNKNKTKSTKPTTTTTTTTNADVLPEILQHSLPLNPPSYAPNHTTTNNPVATSRWNLGGGGGGNPNSVSSKSLNPLRDYIALPQVTFGPNRWSLPQHEHEQALAATANQLHGGGSARDIDPQKLKAAAEGLAQVGKAFAIATIIVFGGATAAFMLVVSKFQLSNVRYPLFFSTTKTVQVWVISEDIKVEGKNILRPRIEKLQGQIAPLKSKVEKISTKWQFKPEIQTKESPFVKDLSKMFGRGTSK